MASLLPVMTSDTTPSGYTASAYTELQAGYEAFRAFDKDTTTFWHGAPGDDGTNSFLEIDCPAAIAPTYYQLVLRQEIPAWPVNWTLEYYDGSAWQPADTQSGFDWTSYYGPGGKAWPISGSYSSDKWRIRVTAWGGSGSGQYGNMAEFDLLDTEPTPPPPTFSAGNPFDSGIFGD